MKSGMKRFAAAVFLTLVPAGLLSGTTLEGRWRLVEQRRGSNPANMVPSLPPVQLEFRAEKSRLAGRVRVGGTSRTPIPWPAYFDDAGPLPVEVRQVWFAPGSSQVRAEYRVKGLSAGDEVVEVAEEYALDESGLHLVGTVTITSRQGGIPQGFYVLHRRFERER
jgi:hypothetical protein